MFSRKVIAPEGRVWRVRPWPQLAATQQGAYHYAGGMGWRERWRERARMIRAIGSGELDATIDQLRR